MPETMVDRLLSAAETLLAERPKSSAFRRRAVSTAYYAVFHSLARICVGNLAPGLSRGSEEYLRVYRALDHGPIKTVFNQSPLKENPNLRRIGSVVARLQSERLRADYLPPDPMLFSFSEAKDLVEQVRQIITDLGALQVQDRRLLAICLLFKTRRD
ncbi:hypothetical protein [Consotaella aegiceratis]|uniref:hypothetical protein n=1 Tax=Consotaella aegiceratis TaxID=3097961 RepID=UPI002F429EAF